MSIEFMLIGNRDASYLVKYDYYESQFRENIYNKLNRYQTKNKDILNLNSMLLKVADSNLQAVNEDKARAYKKFNNNRYLYMRPPFDSLYTDELLATIDGLVKKYNISFELK